MSRQKDLYPFKEDGKWYAIINGQKTELEEWIADFVPTSKNGFMQALVYCPPIGQDPVPAVLDEDGDILEPEETYVWLRQNGRCKWRLETHHYDTFIDALCYPINYKRFEIDVVSPLFGQIKTKVVWDADLKSAKQKLNGFGCRLLNSGNLI